MKKNFSLNIDFSVHPLIDFIKSEEDRNKMINTILEKYRYVAEIEFDDYREMCLYTLINDYEIEITKMPHNNKIGADELMNTISMIDKLINIGREDVHIFVLFNLVLGLHI